jgi:hypothetical protein
MVTARHRDDVPCLERRPDASADWLRAVRRPSACDHITRLLSLAAGQPQPGVRCLLAMFRDGRFPGAGR